MPDDVEKFLSEQQQLESRRQEPIKETLRQKEAARGFQRGTSVSGPLTT